MKQTRSTQGSDVLPLKRRLFYASLVAAIPFLLLGLLEIGLRVGGYGPDLRLFIPRSISGTEYYGINLAVTSRYFPSLHVQPGISSDLFRVQKQPGTVRVFCLGESSTLGYPYMFNGSFPAILRDELREMYPDRPVEVINLGVTAVSSYTVAEFGKWCLDFAPDALVIYTGHNEYYGALGIGSSESVGKYRWIVRTYLKLHEWKIFLLVKDLVGRFAASGSTASSERGSGTLMEALAKEQDIPLGSPTYLDGLRQFEANIGGLVQEARSRGVPVILSTVVSNMRDLAPLRSVHSGTQTGSGELQSALTTDSARGLLKAGLTQQAIAHLKTMLEVDSGYAESAYVLAQACEQAKEFASASIWYRKARDLDALRFRGSSDLNDLIHTIGKENGVPVADPESIMVARSKNGLIGSRYLLEHVHPTLEGYGIVAEAVLDRLVEVLPSGGRVVPVAGRERFRAIVTQVDTISANMRIDILVHSWPFTSTRKTISDLRANTWLEELALGMLRKEFTWEEMHVRAAERYERDGRLKEAADEYRALLAATSYNISPFLRLGSILLKMGQISEARRVLAASLSIERSSRAHLSLAQIAFDAEEYVEAAKELRAALAVGQIQSSHIPDIRLALATALLRAGDVGGAGGEAEKLAGDYPNFAPAQQLRDEVRRIQGERPQ